MLLTLTLLTWNVLGEPADADVRARAIIDEIVAANADVVALQEVSPAFLAALHGDPRIGERGYRGVVANGRFQAPLGLYVLSKFPLSELRLERLPTVMGRAALVGALDVSGRRVPFAVVHLDSHLYLGPTRGRQLLALGSILGDGDAIIMGDLNFGDGAPERLLVPDGMVDAWRAVHPTAPGLTWDVAKNPLARAGCLPGEGSRRLDWVLVRMAGAIPKSATLVGTTPIGTGVPASDHFGVLTTLGLQ